MCLLTAIIAAGAAGATAAAGSSSSKDKTIRLPITKRQQSCKLQRRDVSVTNYRAQLFNDDGSEYLIRIGIGTPPQNFTVALDTGR